MFPLSKKKSHPACAHWAYEAPLWLVPLRDSRCFRVAGPHNKFFALALQFWSVACMSAEGIPRYIPEHKNAFPLQKTGGQYHAVSYGTGVAPTCFFGGGEVGTRPWWLALLACGGAYWPLAFEPSAMTSRYPYYCEHPHCCTLGGGGSHLRFLTCVWGWSYTKGGGRGQMPRWDGETKRR